MAEAAASGSSAKKGSVSYSGFSDVVEIDKASWGQVGVKDQEKVSWSKDNDFKVDKGDLSAKALEFLATDDRFKIDD